MRLPLASHWKLIAWLNVAAVVVSEVAHPAVSWAQVTAGPLVDV